MLQYTVNLGHLRLCKTNSIQFVIECIAFFIAPCISYLPIGFIDYSRQFIVIDKEYSLRY